MIRICIVCEGLTESEFVSRCIQPYLLMHDRYVYPTILRAPSGKHRGGRVTVERLASFISHQYYEADRITTLVDYYGFKNVGGRSKSQLERDILNSVSRKLAVSSCNNIRPYVQMHEFEALLFSDVKKFNLLSGDWCSRKESQLMSIRRSFSSPEDINNGSKTAPSKRISSIFKTYSKTEHGPLIAEDIGVDAISLECPLFGDWLSFMRGW